MTYVAHKDLYPFFEHKNKRSHEINFVPPAPPKIWLSETMTHETTEDHLRLS